MLFKYIDGIRGEIDMLLAGGITERECFEQIAKLCKERIDYIGGTDTCTPRACASCKDDCSGAGGK